MKKIIVVTGGSGFVGTNLIQYLIKKTYFNIISLDDYSSGTKKSYKNNRILYLKDILKKLISFLENIRAKFILFFTLVNFQEFIKVFYK